MSDNQPKLQVYGLNGDPVKGQALNRDQFSNRNDIQKGSTHIWMWRQGKDESREVLLQLRSKSKPTWPGCYDASAAGHVDADETFLEAGIREAKEEIGLSINPLDLHWHFAYRQSGGTICHVYTLKLEGDPDFSFDDGEVERLDWIKLSDFEDWSSCPEEHNLVEDGPRYFSDVAAAIKSA